MAERHISREHSRLRPKSEYSSKIEVENFRNRIKSSNLSDTINKQVNPHSAKITRPQRRPVTRRVPTSVSKKDNHKVKQPTEDILPILSNWSDVDPFVKEQELIEAQLKAEYEIKLKAESARKRKEEEELQTLKEYNDNLQKSLDKAKLEEEEKVQPTEQAEEESVVDKRATDEEEKNKLEENCKTDTDTTATNENNEDKQKLTRMTTAEILVRKEATSKLLDDIKDVSESYVPVTLDESPQGSIVQSENENEDNDQLENEQEVPDCEFISQTISSELNDDPNFSQASETPKSKNVPHVMMKKVRTQNVRFEKKPSRKKISVVETLKPAIISEPMPTPKLKVPLKPIKPKRPPPPVVIPELPTLPKPAPSSLLKPTVNFAIAPMYQSGEHFKPRRRRPPQDRSYELELERARMAERMKAKAKMILEKATAKKAFSNQLQRKPSFEDCEFLAKYCIISKQDAEMYKSMFDSVCPKERYWLTKQEAISEIRHLNPSLKTTEEIYLDRIMELCGYHMNQGADYKLFSLLLAFSKRITALDDWMRMIIDQVDFKTLEMRTSVCRTLWEVNVDHETNTIPLDQLCIELQAGGVSEAHVQEVREKIGWMRSLDLLDFLSYIPLFILLHSCILVNPLDDDRNL